MDMDREKKIEWLKEHLKKNRFKHSLAVEETAGELAERFGLDVEKARRAGLVHDSAKNYSVEEQKAFIEEDGFAIDEYMQHAPALLHGPAGAFIARTIMGETDEEVLDAIRWHTIPSLTPRPLAMVLYLADMIEPGRVFPGVKELRNLANKDLIQAFRAALVLPIQFELGKGNLVHPNTLIVYDQLLILQSKNQDVTIKEKEGRQ